MRKKTPKASKKPRKSKQKWFNIVVKETHWHSVRVEACDLKEAIAATEHAVENGHLVCFDAERELCVGANMETVSTETIFEDLGST